MKESFISFCESAKDLLNNEVENNLNNLLQELEKTSAFWHPNGFIVFRIDDNHPLGSLRLHIWPLVSRTRRPNSPPVHNHVWHLCSQVLVGTYKEVLYRESRPGPGAEQFKTADIKYLVDPNLLTSGHDQYLKAGAVNETQAGEFHTIPAGTPHETLITEGSYVATLLITSPPISEIAQVYDHREIQETNYSRPKLSSSVKNMQVLHLRNSLKNSPSHRLL